RPFTATGTVEPPGKPALPSCPALLVPQHIGVAASAQAWPPPVESQPTPLPRPVTGEGEDTFEVPPLPRTPGEPKPQQDAAPLRMPHVNEFPPLTSANPEPVVAT